MRGRHVAALVCAAWFAIGARALAEEAGAGELGTIAGVVLDKSTGDPIIDAGVEVVDQKRSARTDLDGKYAIKVPPGIYQVRIFAAGFQAVRVQAVSVTTGQAAKADVTLAPATGQAAQGLVVEVVAQASKAAESTQLLKRQKAAAVSDTISAEVIKKSPGSAATDIVTRAPAVTVRNDKFLYVRGLGERYSSALLNGSRLPSTDPEKRAVPLDLFPASFLESVSITKSYTPDLPGDFSGGLADLDLRDFPDVLTGSVSLGTGGNTQSTARTFNTYKGSSLDWVAFGEEARQLPQDVGPTGFYNFKTIDGLPTRQSNTVARSFGNNWAVDTRTAPPNASGSFSVGDAIGPFGFQLAGVYNNEWLHRRNEIQRTYVNTNTQKQSDPEIRDDFLGDRSNFLARIGSLFTSAYKVSDNTKLTFRALYNQNSNSETLLSNGHSFNDPSQLQLQTRLRYNQDSLAWGQLGGEHHFGWMDAEWRSAFSRTTADEPNTRFLVYQSAPPEPPQFQTDSLGAQRLYNEMREVVSDSAVDFTVPFKTALPYTDVWSGLAAKLKFGAAYAMKNRNFQQRRFAYELPNTDFFDLTQPPETLLQPSHIGPGGFQFQETSVPRDQFIASEEIAAGYGMWDLPLVAERLRLIAGVRTEYSYIQLRTFNDQGEFEKIPKNNLNPLPGVNLVYTPRRDMNVRLGYSQTVSRPEFRELSPAFYPAPRGLYGQIGNPSLVQADISSYDARWEWFLSPLEVVSASLFYKDFTLPIEPILTTTSGAPAQSWINADSGYLLGYELEVRKNFGVLSPLLEPLALQVNLSGGTSQVTLRLPNTGQSIDRPISGFAPFLINAALEYTHPRWGTMRLLYNTAGRTLAAVGDTVSGLPDLYDERRDQVDATYLLPLKALLDVPATLQLSVQNITNDPFVRTQAGLFAQRYTTGVKFAFSMSYAF